MHSDNRLMWLVLFLLLALLLSVLLNIFLVKRARHFFREFSLVRLDPLGMAQVDAPDDADLASSPEKRVVLVGDSRAAAWPTPDTLVGFIFINRGTNGHTAVQTQQRFAQHVAPLQPDIVIIQVGMNDLHSIAVLADDKEAIIRACEENIQALVAQSRALGAAVILTTIIPAQTPTLGDRLIWSDEVKTAVTTVNTFIHTQAADDVFILDAHALLADNRGLLAKPYAADTLHVNELGYELLNKALVQLLAQMP